MTVTTAKAKKAAKKESNYICSHCSKGFMQERSFLDHVCTQMQRYQKMKTPDGMSAWLAYSAWLRCQGKKITTQQGFLSSHFYQSFIKFAEFVRAVKNIDVERYARDMVAHNIPPVIWTNDAIYSEWIRSTSVERSPLKLVQQTAVFLMDYAEDGGFDVSDIFDHITSSQLSDWILTGKVTPWFLLGSSKFKTWYSLFDEDDKKYFSQAMNPSEWIDRIRSNPNTVAKVKLIVQEMDL